MRECSNLDPYAIRHEFESADTPEKAERFLSDAGRFWLWERVLWSQFQEWQAYFGWLRMDTGLASKDLMGRKALETASGRSQSFFSSSDKEFTYARFPEDVIKKAGPDWLQETQKKDHSELRHLRTFALHPSWLPNPRRPNILNICWYDAMIDAPPEAWELRTKGRHEAADLEQYLRIEAICILEAIAATIYADRLHRLRYGKCKHCGKLFKIESGHDQQFCPATRYIKTSSCKSAFHQKLRRNAQKKAKAKG
jgi:hypothetical protein